MAQDVEIIGADELILKLEGLIDPEKLQKAVMKACLKVERTAKQKAPKGTGELERSIQSRVEIENNGDVSGVVFTNLEYAPYIEFGTGLFAEEGGRMDVPWNYQDEKGEWHSTSGQHPRPYMRPALNENREEIKRIIKEGTFND